MPLPNIRINRTSGNLRRTTQTVDNIFALVLSGNAVVGKIGLNDPMPINGLASLTDLGITEANNPLAFAEITAFYAIAPEGTKVWLSLFSEATLLADVCDKNTGTVKALLQHADGEIRGAFINKKLASGYTMTKLDGLDQDVWNAAGKMQLLCQEMIDSNTPLFAVLPGQGFTIATSSTLRDLNTMQANQVSISIASDDATGKCAMGTLAGWLSLLPVHENIGWVELGSVSETAWFLDGTSAGDKSVKNIIDALHDKRYIFFRKIMQKSGYFWNDDPTAVNVTDDYSSISWNRVINKAQILCYSSLVNHLLETIDTDPITGGISPTLASDWEGDVEWDINMNMKNAREISAVRCRIDTTQQIVLTDKLTAALEIVRLGQAKTIQVNIGYTSSLFQ